MITVSNGLVEIEIPRQGTIRGLPRTYIITHFTPSGHEDDIEGDAEPLFPFDIERIKRNVKELNILAGLITFIDCDIVPFLTRCLKEKGWPKL